MVVPARTLILHTAKIGMPFPEGWYSVQGPNWAINLGLGKRESIQNCAKPRTSLQGLPPQNRY